MASIDKFEQHLRKTEKLTEEDEHKARLNTVYYLRPECSDWEILEILEMLGLVK